MRIAKLHDFEKGVDKVYWKMNIKDMVNFDSTEEFETLYSEFFDKPAKFVFQNLDALKAFIRDLNTPDHMPFIFDREHEGGLWIKVPYDFVPFMVNVHGEEIFKESSSGELIATDAVYLELYAIKVNAAIIYLYTSAGIKMLNVWTESITGGINERLTMTRFKGKTKEERKTREQLRQRRFIEKFFRSKLPSVGDVRFVHLMLNPLSKAYLSPKLAFKEAYHNYSSIYAEIILESDLIKNLIKKELSTMLDKLQNAIQNAIPPEKFADFLVQMQEKSLEQGSTDDQLKVAHVIAKLGYMPLVANQNNVHTDLLPKDSKGRLDSGQLLSFNQPSTEPQLDKPKIALYGLGEGNATVKIGQGSQERMSAKDLDKLRTDFDMPVGYVSDNFDDDAE